MAHNETEQKNYNVLVVHVYNDSKKIFEILINFGGPSRI